MRTLYAVAALFWLVFGLAQAQTQPIGFVKTVTGEAFVQSGATTVRAQPGTPLHVRDTIRTAVGASLGLTLRDNTLMSLGPSTQFVLEEFLFAPARGDAKLGGRITTGSLHFVSGLIARNRPEAVSIRTPTGTIGVRGTRFVVVVE